jgi:aldehyde dehydrogenase (NAD+)
MGASFTSYEPASGAIVGEFPVDGAAQVAAALDRGRDAASWWWRLGFAGRRDRLRGFAAQLAGRMPEIAALISQENGKSREDARLELVVSIDQLRWAAGHAERVLRRRSLAPGILLPNTAASVEYQPYGVVGVIGPWNYPVFTPMGSIAYALAAGNAVIFNRANTLRRSDSGWLTPSPLRCRNILCCKWLPALVTPARHWRRPVWTNSLSPGQRRPESR